MGINKISLVKEFEQRANSEGIMSKPIKVAIMGCVVNGPGEAREADIGIAGGKGEGLIFKKGEIIKKVFYIIHHAANLLGILFLNN